MTEAVEVVMDYAFDSLGFLELNLCNALGNQRSRMVKERTGARFLRVVPPLASILQPTLHVVFLRALLDDGEACLNR